MFQLKSWYLGREKKKVTLEILNIFDAGVLAQDLGRGYRPALQRHDSETHP